MMTSTETGLFQNSVLLEFDKKFKNLEDCLDQMTKSVTEMELQDCTFLEKSYTKNSSDSDFWCSFFLKRYLGKAQLFWASSQWRKSQNWAPNE